MEASLNSSAISSVSSIIDSLFILFRALNTFFECKICLSEVIMDVSFGSKLDKLEYKIPLICIEFFLKDDYKDFSIFNFKEFKAVKFLEINGYYLVSVCGPSLIFCHKDYWIPYTRL